MKIRNEDVPIGTSGNFRMREFYSHSPDAPPEHDLDDRLISIAEVVRAEYGPVRIHSTFRTPLGNAARGGASSSQHLLGKAVDLSPVNPAELSRFKKDIREGTIVPALAAAGVNGLGIYINFVHLDVRESERPAVWDQTGSGFVEKIREYLMGKVEPGDSAADVRLMVEGVSGLPSEYVGYGAAIAAAFLLWSIWRR